jgi:hypothetical protein
MPEFGVGVLGLEMQLSKVELLQFSQERGVVLTRRLRKHSAG